MNEHVEALTGKTIASVWILTGDDAASFEYMAYVVEVACTDGTIVRIVGCHDSSPHVEGT